MTEADDRFLASLAEELRPRLGPRLSIVGLELERTATTHVAIAVAVASSAGPQSIIQEGESLTEIAARLLERAVEFRLPDGFREMTGPTRT